MKLFNTLERKRQKGFLVVCDTLSREGVDTVGKAEACRQRLHSNAITYVMFVLLLGLSLAMLISAFSFPILVAMAILLIYIVTSTYRAKQFITRYIQDVLLVKRDREAEID